MKAYTDIEQSKKLAEILPLESADMSINHSLFHNMTTVLTTPYKKLHEFFSGDTPDTTLPCWSLAALIEAMPEILIETVKAQDGYDGYYYFVTYEDLIGVPYKKELIDACYEMILRLHEEKLI